MVCPIPQGVNKKLGFVKSREESALVCTKSTTFLGWSPKIGLPYLIFAPTSRAGIVKIYEWYWYHHI